MITRSTAEILEQLATVHKSATHILCAIGAVEQVGELALRLGRSVLLVTDPGLVAVGHAAHVEKILLAAGCKVSRFESVKENPTTDCVDACVQAAKSAGVEAFVALGGGSAMDTAKGCNMLVTNGGKIADYWGVGKVPRPMLPMIAIPTTAGTGSEMQSAALIADAHTHQKMACLDSKALARIAILDATLSASQPARVTASTGIDTIAHALEAYVTRNRNPISARYAVEAFKLARRAFPIVLKEPTNLDAREQMLLAATLAGIAIENSMLGAAHSAANPLTAHFNVLHGQAVGLMLPHVMKYNSQDAGIRQLYTHLSGAACAGETVEGLIDHLECLLNVAGIPRSLPKAGVDPNSIPLLAVEAAGQWTAQYNPRPLTAIDFASLYHSACILRQESPL